MGIRGTALVLLVVLGGAYGCKRADKRKEVQSGLTAKPLAPQQAPAARGFTQIEPAQSGITFSNPLLPKNDRKYIYNGSGIAVGDYDGNGLPDLYFAALDGPNRLYRQTTPLSFEDVTDATGTAAASVWSAGTTFADIDNDGDLDLYVCNLGKPNLLFRNEGGGRFTEVAAQVGLAHEGASVMAGFADADRDGDLDLYLLTNRMFAAGEEAHKAKVRLVDGKPTVHPDFVEQYTIIEGHFAEAGQADRFYLNNGDGTFIDATDKSGITGYDMGLSVTWWDFDNDGFPDIYVANDMMGPDRLYHNQRDGTFKDVAKERLPHTSWFSMGADAADINNDGLLDFFVGDMSATNHFKQKTTMGAMSRTRWFLESAVPRQYMRNALLLNTGTERFMEIAHMAGLASTNWTWAVRFGDLDNDGWVDLFVTNGHSRNANQSDLDTKARALLAQDKKEEALAVAMALPPLPERNLAFRNTGDLAFEQVEAAWGLGLMGVSHGASLVDLDRDGDLDIAVNNLNKPAAVYRNDLAPQHRILVELRGKESNRFGVGARVEVETAEGRQVRELHHAHGYLTGEEPVLHFGLGAGEKVARLTVRWPSGRVQRFEGLAADQHYTIGEVTDVPSATVPESQHATQFERVPVAEMGLSFRHKERAFDDYAREPLLPYRLSQEGPGIAVTDLNDDGRDDVIVGGAAGQAGGVYLQAKSGNYKRLDGPWRTTTEAEDQGVLAFDADADGDQDVLFVSGGTESDAGAATLRDRLFLNEEGRYRAAGAGYLKALPESGGPAAVADIDRDGDLDLFIGGRTRPGGYPRAEPSRLWIQGGSGFVDETGARAPSFETLQPVHSARFTDVDDDGWLDLVLATEWGPVRLFWNDEGRLVDRTEEAGLAPYTGFWNGVEAGDFDGDGDMDLVATNRGLNTKYHGSQEHPAILFARDFDQDGRVDLVEVDAEEGTLYPSRGLSCSSEAMPSIRDRFPTYDAFGRASLEDLYGGEALAEATRYTAAHLAHTVFVNDGEGGFSVKVLPRLAQASVAYGVVVNDFDADGQLDLFLAQNSFSPQPETGHFDGGLGSLLRGTPGAEFKAVGAADSGIVLAADAKGASVGDLDGDGAPDLVVATNDGPLVVFRNRLANSRFVRLRLAGKGGNPSAIGAHVTLKTKAGSTLLREVSAGGGYQSQSSGDLWFGVPVGDAAVVATVRWPDGVTSSHKVTGQTQILDQP